MAKSCVCSLDLAPLYKSYQETQNKVKYSFLWKIYQLFFYYFYTLPVGIYLLKVNNRNTRTRCWLYFTHCSSVSIVNFKHVIADWENLCQWTCMNLNNWVSNQQCKQTLKYFGWLVFSQTAKDTRVLLLLLLNCVVTITKRSTPPQVPFALVQMAPNCKTFLNLLTIS